MTLFGVVLFLHIAVAIAAFVLSGVMHTSEYLLNRSSTAADALRMLKVQRLAPIFGVLVVLLFGLGSLLVHLSGPPDKFSFSDPFVYTAIVVLAVVLVDGPLILGRYANVLGAALAQSPDGGVPARARALMANPLPLVVSYGNTFVVLGVVFDMAVKPTLPGCLASLLVGLVAGVAIGFTSTRAAPAATAAG